MRAIAVASRAPVARASLADPGHRLLCPQLMDAFFDPVPADMAAAKPVKPPAPVPLDGTGCESPERVRAFIEAGGDVNRVLDGDQHMEGYTASAFIDFGRGSPLHWACFWSTSPSCAEVVALLLADGKADASLKSTKGYTPLQILQKLGNHKLPPELIVRLDDMPKPKIPSPSKGKKGSKVPGGGGCSIM